MSETRTARTDGQEPGSTGSQGPKGSLSLDLQVAKLSDVGRVRPHNEDYVDYYIPPDARQLARKGSIYLVADGMGGHQAGEVASRGAVELTIGQYYGDTAHDVATSLVRAFRSANQQIYDQAQADPSKGGMGTTLVAAVIVDQKVFVANVGDSRAYLINAKSITQITEDHSWVEEQVRAGLLTPEQARRHPQRNLVTRALGSKPDVQVDLFEGEISVGDSLLMCSDGLSGRVEDQELAAIVRQYPPQEAARQLVALANERGGNDNISVLIVIAEREATTVAAVVAPPVGKPARKSLLAPVLAGALLVLALVAGGVVGFPYLRSFLAGTPTVVASAVVASSVPTDTVTAGVQPSATAVVVVTSTATVSPTVTVSVTLPTATLAPTATATITSTGVTAVATKAPTATETSTVAPTPDYPAPILQEPKEQDAQSLHGLVTFSWSYEGTLAQGQAFQVLIWRQGSGARNGAAEFTTKTQQTIDLNQVDQVQQGGSGEYLWSVVLVQQREGESEQRLKEATPWRFTYVPAQSSSRRTKEPPVSGPVAPPGP
jgi:serine/threonine protein phosphatase PrpC